MTTGQTIIAAFSEEQVERLTGVRQGQLRYWDRTGFFSPSFPGRDWGDTFGRVYSFKDVVALRVLGSLRNQYSVSLQHLRDVKENLVSLGMELWIGVKLYVVKSKVVWLSPHSSSPEEFLSQQFILPTIELDVMVQDTKDKARELLRRDPATVGHINRHKGVQQNAPVIAGTRIRVRAIKRFSEAGYTTEQILEEYPDLTEEDVAAALSYQQAA